MQEHQAAKGIGIDRNLLCSSRLVCVGYLSCSSRLVCVGCGGRIGIVTRFFNFNGTAASTDRQAGHRVCALQATHMSRALDWLAPGLAGAVRHACVVSGSEPMGRSVVKKKLVPFRSPPTTPLCKEPNEGGRISGRREAQRSTASRARCFSLPHMRSDSRIHPSPLLLPPAPPLSLPHLGRSAPLL
jgi:hypothetical protein